MFYEVNKRLHRIHGFSGGLIYVVWAILLDLAALASIIFSITGILIWFNSRRHFRLGWFFFILPLVLVIIMMFYLH
ncbi:MAG: hypothetical protein HC906_08745 [Bacteroidales bacterium]|nr:hypothetical protein [Bacteroidales bacterium]